MENYIAVMLMIFWLGLMRKKILNEIPEPQGWDWNDVLIKQNGGNKMIKINERFSIERLDDCWLLVETKPGYNHKTKTETMTQKKSRYPRLCHVVDEISKRTTSEFGGLDESIFLVKRI
jgi:hypothetical protein